MAETKWICERHGEAPMFRNEFLEGWECRECNAEDYKARLALLGWHWMFVTDVTWRRWGLGVEFSLGDWSPREWSIHLHLGPLLVCFGREQNDE